jgi:hypothetical protein
MIKDKALKLALEALENIYHADTLIVVQYSTIKAIREALAAPVQEPVAWITQAGVLTKTDTKAQGELYGWTPLYTAPEPAQEPNNFCPRCGKRLEGVLGRPQMHTCTPPLWGHK